MPAAPWEPAFLLFAGSRDAAAAPHGSGRSGNSRQRNSEKTEIRTENELEKSATKWLSVATFLAWHLTRSANMQKILGHGEVSHSYL